jgi:hypothetical protein
MNSLKLLLLLLYAMALPIGAVLLVRWARRRERQLKGAFGHWTANESKILERQATERGHWRRAFQMRLLSPVVTKHANFAHFALWLAIGALLALAAFTLYAVVHTALG